MSDQAPSQSQVSVKGAIKFGFINETNNRPQRPNLRLRFSEYIVNNRGFNSTGEVESGTLNTVGPFLSYFLTFEGQERGAAYELIPLLPEFENAVISSRLTAD